MLQLGKASLLSFFSSECQFREHIIWFYICNVHQTDLHVTSVLLNSMNYSLLSHMNYLRQTLDKQFSTNFKFGKVLVFEVHNDS